MAKRFTCTEKWRKRWIRELSPRHKLFWIFILDTCNHAGIADFDLPLFSFMLGVDFDIKEIKKDFGDKLIFFKKDSKVFIPAFIDFQYGLLNESNKVHLSVLNILKKNNVYKLLISPLQGSKDKDKDMDKDKDKETRKKFKKPSVTDLEEYAVTLKVKLDCDSFLDHYESNGWLVGKNKMKDWKATVRKWIKRDFNETGKKPYIDFKLKDKLTSLNVPADYLAEIANECEARKLTAKDVNMATVQSIYKEIRRNK